MEADLYPKNSPSSRRGGRCHRRGFEIHEQYGYYAQGVAPDTATLPRGWQRRLVRIENSNTGGYAGLCLEVHDLALSNTWRPEKRTSSFTRGSLVTE